MHVTVIIVTDADNPEDAKKWAETSVQDLCTDSVFDWGAVEEAYDAASDEGRQLIEGTLDEMDRIFSDNIAKIRRCVNAMSDDELRIDLKFRIALDRAAQVKGPSVLFYDPYNNGLPTREDVDCILPPDEKVYIVAVDMHY